MYISREQIELTKMDADFRKKIKEAKEDAKSVFDSCKDYTPNKLFAINELSKVQKPTYKSKKLKIENGVLLRCNSTNETVFIPVGFTEIGKDAFKECRHKHSHTKIVFPEGLKKIGTSAFEDYDRVFNLDVKDVDLCYHCDSIWKSDEFEQFSRGFSQFPNTLEEIGDFAFRNIGENAYVGTKKLMEYLIQKAQETIELMDEIIRICDEHRKK